MPNAIARTEIAAMYREINGRYQIFYDGHKVLWDSLTVAQVERWLEQAEVAMACERSWRRESGFVGCLYGARGCAPFAFVFCTGCQEAQKVPTVSSRATQVPSGAGAQGGLG